MKSFKLLQKQRRQILSELHSLDQIRRGSINQQYVEVLLKDGTKTKRGPYTTYTFKDDQQKTVSRYLGDPAEVQMYQKQIDGFRQFQQLTRKFLSIGEQLSDLAVEDPSALKKTRLLSWNKKTR